MLSLQHRPHRLSEMVGQPLIIDEMKNRSKDMRFAQSMVMEGDTGSGKTTLSLIIASLLNCKNPNQHEDGYYEPCLECESCKDITSERFKRDVYLYDASTMGKDDVLDLQHAVNVRPMYDANKIIVVDEAQELSKAGFGATLKLLEKPRDNTYLILCTMDQDAIDRAIKTRCQTYRFKKVKTTDIAQYLFHIIENSDEIEVPDEFISDGLFLISEFADGSVREALQYLERCVYGKYYTKDIITKELGTVSKADMSEILFLLLRRDKAAFERLHDIEDMKSFFYYTYTILMDVVKYKISGFLDQEWKEKPYQIMKNEQNLLRLKKAYDTYMQNASSSYFNARLFESMILQYYFDTAAPSGVTKRKRVPIT